MGQGARAAALRRGAAAVSARPAGTAGAPAAGTVAAPGTTLVRTATALMTSTAGTAALSFVFWIAAARWFPPETVGRVAAAAAAMALLAALAQLNLVSLYARFLPTAGARTRPLVVAGYGASAAMSVLLTVGFFLSGFATGLIGGGWVSRLAFTAAVIASAVFFIQGGVLTALGRAAWVPAAGGVTSAARLALLPLLAGFAAGDGLLLAWVLPIVAVMAATTWWVLARGAPAHARARPAAAPVRPREVLRFASAEYVNGMLSNAAAFLPPVLVAGVLGAVPGAYFYLPWLIGISVTTLLWNVVTSFVVAAAGDGTPARADTNRALYLVLAIVLPGTLVLSLGATPLLGLLGGDYAAEGAAVLRLLGLSLPFAAVVLVFSAFSILEKRMWRLVAVQAAGAALLFAGVWIGLPRLGAVAPALSLLAAQAAVGLALLPAVVRAYRRTGRPPEVPRSTPPVPVGRVAATASSCA
jgi:O-antigen/teichoic acid export membrane protein